MAGLWAVRAAVSSDVGILVGLAAKRREEYRRYQPQFWRPAPDAAIRQRAFFLSLVDEDGVAVLVATDERENVAGFLVARNVDAPPVYDPGGRTCMVDDFTVRDDSQWLEVGTVLFGAVVDWASGRRASQIVVVTANLDDGKRRLLAGLDLTLASEWWVGRVPSSASEAAEANKLQSQ